MDKNKLYSLMETLGFEKAKKSGFVCPFCDNGAGSSGTGIEPYRSKDGNNKYYLHCFGADCISETKGLKDVLDWVIRKDGKENLSYPERIEYIKNTYNVDLEKEDFLSSLGVNDFNDNVTSEKKAPREQLHPVTNYNYLLSRGIEKETQRRFQVGYVENYYTKGFLQGSYIAIPVGKWDINNQKYVMRATDSQAKNRVINHGGTDVFNIKAFENKNDIVFITEGAIDSLTIEHLKDIYKYDQGRKELKSCHGVSINGAGNHRLLKPYVNHYQKYVVLMDWDEPGRKAGKQVKEYLDSLGVASINAHDYIKEIPVGKDLNDLLVNHKLDPGLLIDLVKAAKQDLQLLHEKNSVSNSLSWFKDIKRQEENRPINTGFTFLNDALDGGIREGLYIIGAVSSLGKTTFMLQVADNIARYNDVIFFSLEMSTREIISKSLSRYMYNLEKDTAKTVNQIMDVAFWKYKASERENKALNKAVESYENDLSNHLYIYEGRLGEKRIGVEEVRQVVKSHYEMTGRKPVVIVDYLQILAPGDTRATDKQNTDTAVFELKEISRDYKIPVFAISSFNRESYRAEVSLTSFKESGAIEYSSDILLGLQYDGLEDYDQTKQKKEINAFLKKSALQDTRKVVLKILKNRNGRKDISVKFDYVPRYNCFKDTGIDDKYIPKVTKKDFKDDNFLI